ncbi:MAG: adenylate cyclase [Gammaproteobacteria bacterium RIFCSPHIGHO2_12_FULL_38_14]|nr:MAG: adenylate cyclase [Gammaproteobacteria bacterium RIFCSPHIGHO2_12_FULL_38_14]
MTKQTNKEELDRLAALYELNILDTPEEERFNRIVRLAAKILGVPSAYIAFLDTERQWFKAKIGIEANETPRNISFCTHTIQQDDPLIVPDALLDPRFANSPLVQDDPHTRFYAGFPLSSPGGHKVGTLCIVDKQPRTLSPTHLSVFQDLAMLAEDQLALMDIVKFQQQIRSINSNLHKAKEELELRNEFIKKVFSSYMSDAVVNSLLESSEALQLGGEQREITVLFSDLRNFTTLSEHSSADQVVTALNTYFERMVDVILKHHGTIDAFIGDAIMVLFGAPNTTGDDEKRAVACAIDMQLAMEEVNQENQKKGLPHLSMGIGINTGKTIVGNVGSLKRMKYSAIGTPVNLASRIQSLSLGGQILISEETFQKVRDITRVDGCLQVKVKGISRPVKIYDISGVAGEYQLFLPEKFS